MKKIYVWLGLTFFLLNPLSVKGASNIEFSCPDKVMIGNSIKCNIMLENTDKSIKGLQANYEFGDTFSYVQTSAGTNWEIASAHTQGVMAINLNGTTEKSTIVQTEFLISDKATVGQKYEIKLKNVKLSDGEQDISIENKSFEVKVLSILDIVKNITINGSNLELKDGVTDYTINVENSIQTAEIEVNLTSDEYGFKEGFAPKKIENLLIGDNVEKVTIVKGDQELLSFNFHINRSQKEIVEENITNPETGSSFYIVIGILLIISVGALLYGKKRLEGNKNE